MVSKLSSKLMTYRMKLKELLDENVVDIILFGSAVKGGSPRDVDVALLARNKGGLAEKKKKITELIAKADVQILDIESVYLPLWLTLIKEGFSVKRDAFIHELYNLKPVVLYKYSLGPLTPVQKVQFERGLKKVLQNEGEILTRSVVLVPLTLKSRMMEFLKTWNIYYETREYELVPFLRKEEWL